MRRPSAARAAGRRRPEPMVADHDRREQERRLVADAAGDVERERHAEHAWRQQEQAHVAVARSDGRSAMRWRPRRACRATRSATYPRPMPRRGPRQLRARAGHEQHQHDQRVLDEEHVARDRLARPVPGVAPESPAVSPPKSADIDSASATPPTSSSAETANTRSSVSDDAWVSSSQPAPARRSVMPVACAEQGDRRDRGARRDAPPAARRPRGPAAARPVP